MKGIFITFEGVDGCGKSTQMKLIGEYLTASGYDIVFTREPGGCSISEKIRDLLLDTENSEMYDRTEALLYAAARAQHIAQVVKPALEKGKVVLCDRFIDSSLAYQGIGRGLGIENIMDINRFGIQKVMPDKTFFLDYPPRLAFERMSKKRVHDRLEKEDFTFYDILYDGFKKLCALYPQRIIRIDASGDKFETNNSIKLYMENILAER